MGSPGPAVPSPIYWQEYVEISSLVFMFSTVALWCKAIIRGQSITVVDSKNHPLLDACVRSGERFESGSVGIYHIVVS
jgi:hypothetical protein